MPEAMPPNLSNSAFDPENDIFQSPAASLSMVRLAGGMSQQIRFPVSSPQTMAGANNGKPINSADGADVLLRKE